MKELQKRAYHQLTTKFICQDDSDNSGNKIYTEKELIKFGVHLVMSELDFHKDQMNKAKYCWECGEPIKRKHKFWCKNKI